MTNERSYSKQPDGAKPAPANGDIPTVDVAGELATQRIGPKQPAPQPDPTPAANPIPTPAPAQDRPLWSMPKPQEQQPAQPAVPPPPAQSSVDQTQRLPFPGKSQPAPVQQGLDQSDVDQTQRLPFGSQSQSAPLAAAQGQPSQQSVEATQRLPFPAQPQIQPQPQSPSQPQTEPQSGPLLRAPDARPLFEEPVKDTKRLPYPQHQQPRNPGRGNESPDRTQTYQVEETAQGQPPTQYVGQPQPHYQQQFQPQPQPQPQPQAQGGGYGAPAPTLRFDGIQDPGDDQPLGPGEYRHFGPGVPAPSGAPSQAAAVWRGEAVEPPPVKPKRRRAFAGWLLTLAVLGIVLGILGWFYYFGAPLKVTSATVKGPTAALTCDSTATITATLQTNGNTGSVTYEWKRSDNNNSGVLTQHFNKGTNSATVTLLWTIKGQGTLKSTATLDVLTPNAITSAATFDYSCDH